jgi:hypothetical protein
MNLYEHQNFGDLSTVIKLKSTVTTKVPGKLCELLSHLDKICTGRAGQVLYEYVARLNQLQHGYLLLVVLSHQHISWKAEQNHQTRASQTSHTNYSIKGL